MITAQDIGIAMLGSIAVTVFVVLPLAFAVVHAAVWLERTRGWHPGVSMLSMFAVPWTIVGALLYVFGGAS